MYVYMYLRWCALIRDLGVHYLETHSCFFSPFPCRHRDPSLLPTAVCEMHPSCSTWLVGHSHDFYTHHCVFSSLAQRWTVSVIINSFYSSCIHLLLLTLRFNFQIKRIIVPGGLQFWQLPESAVCMYSDCILLYCYPCWCFVCNIAGLGSWRLWYLDTHVAGWPLCVD